MQKLLQTLLITARSRHFLTDTGISKIHLVPQHERWKTESTMKFSALLWILIGLGSIADGQSAGKNAPQPSAQPALFQRAYRLDTHTFTNMRRFLALTNDQSGSDGQVLRSYLKQKGVELSLPSTLFYTYGEKSLVVRSTKENLDTIERFLADIKEGK